MPSASCLPDANYLSVVKAQRSALRDERVVTPLQTVVECGKLIVHYTAELAIWNCCAKATSSQLWDIICFDCSENQST
jgi:hypothetical protein